jgi:penicillin-binding protein 1C
MGRRKAVRWSVIAAAAVFCVCAVALALKPLEDFSSLRSFETVKNSYKRSEALLLDRNGEILHEFRVDKKGRRLEWMSLDDISPALIKAVLFVEDRRFFEHKGVDWQAVASSAFMNARGRHFRGASTISMQLAAMLDKRLRARVARRGVAEKWRQVCAAKALEKGWTKKQILEAYLNLVTFRGELQGVTAASKGLFDKVPSGLDSVESLVLASLITAPNAGTDNVIARTVFFIGK